MVYRLYLQKETRLFTENNSRCKIPYLPVKKLREMYPDGNFVVIGEVGIIAQALPGQDTLLISGGTEVPIFPRGCMSRHIEWIAGYTAVGENTYVAVVQNLIPSFFLFGKRKRIGH